MEIYYRRDEIPWALDSSSGMVVTVVTRGE